MLFCNEPVHRACIVHRVCKIWLPVNSVHVVGFFWRALSWSNLTGLERQVLVIWSGHRFQQMTSELVCSTACNSCWI